MLKAQKHHASAEGDDWTQVVAGGSEECPRLKDELRAVAL